MEELRATFGRLVNNIDKNLDKEDALFKENSHLVPVVGLYEQLKTLVLGYKILAHMREQDKFILDNLRKLALCKDKWISTIDMTLDIVASVLRAGDFLNHQEIIEDAKFIIIVAKNIPSKK